MAYHDLKVKAPEGSGYINPQAMKRVDDHISMLGGLFCSPPPTNMPVQNNDGTWTVRVLDEANLFIVKGILTKHYGLEIVDDMVCE